MATKVLIFQVDAVLRLIETLSPSLSAEEITAIRRTLALAYESTGDILERRNLEIEGFTLVGEFRSHSLSSLC